MCQPTFCVQCAGPARTAALPPVLSGRDSYGSISEVRYSSPTAFGARAPNPHAVSAHPPPSAHARGPPALCTMKSDTPNLSGCTWRNSVYVEAQKECLGNGRDLGAPRE